MDDDQFQQNLNVQGGNPEPTAPSEEQAAPVEQESEMARRMNEILGSFDDGIATAGAISSGNGKIVQGTAVRVNAPRPDFAQRPAAAPVRAEVTVATEGVYDTNAPAANPVDGVTAPAEFEKPAENTTDTSAPSMGYAPAVSFEPISETPGKTPVMAGVPRSSLEQAAAEKAVRDAVAEAERKKIDPKIIIGIVAAILIIAVAVVVIAVALDGKKDSGKKDDGGNSQPAEPEPEPEPVVEMQRIGTADHGYISVPKEWARVVELEDPDGFWYGDKEAKSTVTINSTPITATVTTKFLVDREMNNAKKDENVSQPQMTTEKYGSYTMYKIFYFRTDTKRWTFEYLFDAEDQRIHCILLKTGENTNSLVSSIPESWSLNQNASGDPVKKPDDGKDSDDEDESDDEEAAEDETSDEESTANKKTTNKK